MSEEEEKFYACSVCGASQPKSLYSSKQLKKKGKRVCSDCVGTSSSASNNNHQSNGKDSAGAVPDIAKSDNEVVGKKVVRDVPAVEVEKAQGIWLQAAPSPDDDKFEVFLKWLVEGGTEFPLLQMKYYTVDYRGVHAKQRIQPNTLVLKVPLKQIITLQLSKDSPIGQALQRHPRAVQSSHTYMAAYLLQEKHNPTSFWKPYLEILPAHYRNMPVFFDQEELKWLKGSFTLQMIADRKFSLRREYDQLSQLCPEFARFHHLEFVWGRLAVITRIFGFEVGAEKHDGLVPMADMLNHKRPHETTWSYDDVLGGFTIVTTRRLLKGAQIFDSYGRKCNSRYFVNYGFSLENNEDNQVAMNFILPKEDELFARKARLVGERARRCQIPFDHCERVTVSCMAFLRVVYADAADMDKIEELLASGVKIREIPGLNPRNEAAILVAIAAAAKEVLAGFDTSVEYDRKLLDAKDSKITMNQRNCVVMRLGEKEVLEAYIDLGTRAAEWAKMNYREWRKMHTKEIRDQGKRPDVAWRLDRYCKDIWIPFYTGEKVEIEITSNAHEGD
eukprot:gb/GEZN01002871.1/.p1 GENE.gb/GEZN01002871.1/~~gb/GEZN01002871.1/.p1  ORF type:complete len:559 (-),score=89.75 gb/GEZN01002871.1/:565-2241(-)